MGRHDFQHNDSSCRYSLAMTLSIEFLSCTVFFGQWRARRGAVGRHVYGRVGAELAAGGGSSFSASQLGNIQRMNCWSNSRLQERNALEELMSLWQTVAEYRGQFELL